MRKKHRRGREGEGARGRRGRRGAWHATLRSGSHLCFLVWFSRVLLLTHSPSHQNQSPRKDVFSLPAGDTQSQVDAVSEHLPQFPLLYLAKTCSSFPSQPSHHLIPVRVLRATHRLQESCRGLCYLSPLECLYRSFHWLILRGNELQEEKQRYYHKLLLHWPHIREKKVIP